MANHKSSAKRARQDLKKKTRKLGTKNTVRTYEKQLRAAIVKKDSSSAAELLKTFTSRIDKAATKGVYHTKAAARKISRLASQVAQISK